MAIGAVRLDGEPVAVEQLQQPSARPLCQRYFGLAAADVGVGLGRVKAFEPQVDALQPNGVAIYHAGVPLSATHAEVDTPFLGLGGKRTQSGGEKDDDDERDTGTDHDHR